MLHDEWLSVYRRPPPLLGNVKSDIELPALTNEVSRVAAPVSSRTQRTTPWYPHQHVQRRVPLSHAIRLGQLKVAHQYMAIVHQWMSHEHQLHFLALTLPHRHCIRVGRAQVGGVAQLLPPKVTARSFSIARRAIVVITTSEAPYARGCLYQCPVHAEVLIRHQAASVRHVRHLLEQLPSHPVSQESSSVLGEHRRIEARFHQVHVQEPAIEQVAVQLLAKRPLTTDRVQRDQQQCLQQTLGRHRGATDLRVHTLEIAGHAIVDVVSDSLGDPGWMIRWDTLVKDDGGEHRVFRLLQAERPCHYPSFP